jgi:hypothetical protein
MPAGLVITNDDGYLQITDDLKNFVFLAKGSVALDGAPWSVDGREFGAKAQIVFPNTFGYPPVVALRCANYVAVFRTRLVSGNWVIDITSQLGANRTDTVYWWAFGPPPTTTPSFNGLEVRDASGVLMYHTDYKPMVVRDYQSQALGSSGSFSIASGRTLAVAILSSQWGWSPQVPAGTWQQFLMSTAVRETGTNTATLINNLQYGQKFAPANYGWPGATSGVWSAMALDVTGL